MINTHRVDIVYNIRAVSELLASNQEVTTTMASAQLQISSLNLELDKLVDNRSALLLGMKQAEEKLSKLNDEIAEKASKKQKLERQDLTNLKSA